MSRVQRECEESMQRIKGAERRVYKEFKEVPLTCTVKMRPEMVDSSIGSSVPIVLFAIKTEEHLHV